ncbi:unnamed protein product [Closterium sp. NIES-53]
MVADSSDNNPKSNGGAEKKKERTAGQFFHIGEKGEQGDASAKVGAELHPLYYWVLDTGAAWTMTPRKELLDDVRAAPINEVCSASGHALKVAGAGRAAFKGADCKPVVLHDVVLVPDLKANLISLRKLAKAGVSTSTDGARTYKGQLRNRVLWDLHESKDMYRSMWQLSALAWHGGGQAGEGSASQGECNAVGGVGVKVSARSGETDWATAHRRLGHLSKFTRFPFHSVTGRSKKPLELVHMDLVGPLPVQGHKGERYFLTIVDDWSRLMWAYPLKQKDHAASTIKEDWLPFVEKQAECVVKRIRTDLGGEFLGAEMTAWLKKQGIQRELTTAYTPQSNGVAERANRTILETARALLIESGVGNSMWPRAVRHTTVARNRVLTKVGNESWVPLERWFGRKPPVDMLRVFGCMAVAHVPKKYRSKLGASAIWCVHLGLAAKSKGWLLWEPSKGVLFDSRDVKFVEGMMYGGWMKQPETKVSLQMEQITMQLDLTPSVWEEGEEAAAEAGDGEKVQEAPGGGEDDVETIDSTKEAAGSEGGEQQLGKAKAKREEEQEEGEEEAVEAVAVAEVVLQRSEVKGIGKAMFKGADGKMVGLKNVLWVPNLAANLISVRRLQKADMDTSSKGAKTYTARLGERILWDLHEDRDVYNEMWQIPMVPMPKERQVAASISTKGEAVGSGDGANGRAKEIESKNCNLGGTSQLGEHEESGAAAQKQHKDEENPKAAAEEEYGESMWGTIASAAFSNPTSATGECDWLTLHRRMGHVALPILQQLVKTEMVAGIRVKGEPDEFGGAKAPLDEVVMDVVGPLKLGAARAEYFLTIVDVYTHMTWVYVLSKKSDVAETPAKSALVGTALLVGDDEESDYEECAFAFFSPVGMPGEPATLKEALESSDAEEWKKAMESELKSIEENGTWELVELPEGRKAITSKWLFKIKSDADGKIERDGSRLVAKGYQQKEKVHYKELFAPVVKLTTLRTLLAGATIKGWVVKQMDVTTAFLNGILEEEIFMAQPEGFDDGSGRVLKPKKALYGLKQAPRQWYLKLRGVLEEIGFTPSTADHSLFMLGEGEQRSFMEVYVDDILILSPSSALLKEVMLKLQEKFKCKALGDVSFYLRLHIERDVEKRCMRVHQRDVETLAANFGQSEGHVATPFPSGFNCVKGPEEESIGKEERRRFHSLVVSLTYAAVNTRLDIASATGQLARDVQCPNEEQVAAGMRLAKYLGQTATIGLPYSAAAQRRQKGADGVEPGCLFLTAFSNASYASEPEDMTSVGGFICCVGGGPTAWESKKQVDQALSSVESEYMALFRAVRGIVW